MLFDQHPARVQAEIARVEESLEGLPVAVLRPVRNRKLTDRALERRRLNERDTRFRLLVPLLPAQPSTYAMCMAIRGALTRYYETGWQFDKGRAPPDHPAKRLMFEILTLDKGKIRSRGTIKRALAGTRSNFGQ